MKKAGTLSKIFMLERMGNIFPLLIASWLRFGDDGPRLEGILKLLETFIVRVYLVSGYRGHTESVHALWDGSQSASQETGLRRPAC